MRIGITGVKVDDINKDAVDVMRYITLSGNTPKMIYADSLDIILSKEGISIMQSSEKASGAGSDETLIDVDGVLLRHLGTIRDYEQFMNRISCIRAFEAKGIYVMNPVVNWLFASDKFATLLELAKHKIPVPETVVTEQMFIAYNAVKRFKSAVIKPLRSAMGFGVFKVDDPDLALHAFSYFTNMNKPIYTQKFLEKIGDGDYRVVVVGGKVLGAEFRKGTTWKSNVAQGAVPKGIKPNSELVELSLKTAEALGLEYAGIDIAETKDGYFVLETNPTLSWQGFKKATGINPAKYIVERLIENIKS